MQGISEIVNKKPQLFYIIMRFYNQYYSFMNLACKRYHDIFDTADVFISSNIINATNCIILPEEFLYHTSMRIGLLNKKEYYNIAFYIGYTIISQVDPQNFTDDMYIQTLAKHDYNSILNVSMFCSNANIKAINKFNKKHPEKYNLLLLGYGCSVMRDAMLNVHNIQHIKKYIDQYILSEPEIIKTAKLFKHKQKQSEFIIKKIVAEILCDQTWLFC